MAKSGLDKVVRHICRVTAEEHWRSQTDGALLRAFVQRGDQNTFAVLVKRYGPLILATCRRVLRQLEDAEDAFQATFIVLARQARTLAKNECVGGWLHRVAHRLSLNARRALERRHHHERQSTAMNPTNPEWEAAWREVQILLDEEIQRLPERYRAPFIICALGGESCATAAKQLELKEGTVRSRLAEARKRLQARLSRRGVELTGVLGAAALAPGAATPKLAPALVAKAVSAATGAAVPASVAKLVKALTAGLAIKKAKVGMGLFIAFSAMVGTTSMWAFQDRPGAKEPAQRAGKQEAAVTVKPAVAKDIYGDPLPVGALARMGSIRMRHAGLSGFVILADGKTALTAGGDGVLRFWDLDTGEQKRTVKLDGVGPGRWLALAPNGKTVAALDKDKIVIMEVDSGRQIKTVPAPKGGVNSLCFSPDGQALAVGRPNWEFTFLEWTTGKERQVKLPVFTPDKIEFSMDSTFHGSFSPDGKWFVAGAWSHQPLGIFDFGTGREVYRLDCHALTSTVSPDSKRLAVSSSKTGGGSDTAIRLFDLASGKEIVQFPQGKIHGFLSLAFAPDGNTLACAFSDDTCLLDLRTGKVVYRLPGRPLDPAFMPDGKTLVTSDGHSLHCWDAASGKELQPRPGEFGDQPILAISPDGQRLASGDWMNQNVDIWNPTTSRQLTSLPLKGEQRYVRNLAFTRDGQTLISAQGMGLLQYWSTATGQEQRALQLRDSNKSNQDIIYFFQLHVCADGKHIATLDRVFTQPPVGVPSKEITRLAQWDAGTGKLLRQHALPAKTRVCAWLADGACVAFPETDGLTMMEVESGRSRWHVAGPTSAGPLAASPDACLLAALQGGSSGTPFTVGIWEVASGKEVTTVNTGRVWRLALAPDNRSLVTTGDGILKLWDLATGNEQGHWALPVGAWRLLLSPDGRRAFTALADGSALVWDLTSGLHAIDLSVKDAGPKEMATWWEDMSGDADRAYAVVWRLAEVKEDAAVSFLRQKLKPIGEADLQKIQMHINELGSESFKVREQARQQLESLGSAAVPAMRLALETSSSLEVRRRLEGLLSRPFMYPPKALRYLRAIQVLERIATKDARLLLTEIANGVAHACETQEAKASLERLVWRASKLP